MKASELHSFTSRALGKDPAEVPENPNWDSLDQIELIAHLHDEFGEKLDNVEGLDTFNDLESLTVVLRDGGVID
jgi:acyl carrier protein